MFTVSGTVVGETVTAIGAATFNAKDVTTANLVTANSNTLEDGTGLASNYSLATGQTVASAITTKANNSVNPAWDTSSIWTLNSVNYPLLTSLFKIVARVTANNSTQTYQGAAYTSGYTASTVMATGFAGPLSGSLSYSGTSQTGINVGSYVIALEGQSYVRNPLNVVRFINSTLNIIPKALTATIAAAINQIYNDMFSQIFRNWTRTTFLQAYKFSNP